MTIANRLETQARLASRFEGDKAGKVEDIRQPIDSVFCRFLSNAKWLTLGLDILERSQSGLRRQRYSFLKRSALPPKFGAGWNDACNSSIREWRIGTEAA